MCTHRISYIVVPAAGLLLGACTTQAPVTPNAAVAGLPTEQSAQSANAADDAVDIANSTPEAARTETPSASTASNSDHGPAIKAPEAKREAADGFIRAVVTTQVSVLDEGGALKKRIPRDRIKIGESGIPYRNHAPGSDHLIVADLGQGEVLLDSAEFDIDPKEALVSEKCESIRTGRSPRNNSAASMGHGERCQ